MFSPSRGLVAARQVYFFWVSRLPSVISRTFSFYRYGSNVTVQGTRHLVEGTLEPIVVHLLVSVPF